MAHFSLDIQNGIANVAFNMTTEKVNKFNRDVFDQLADITQQIESDTSIEWVIFNSTKPGIFIAGADIKELSQTSSLDDAKAIIHRGHDTFDRWANLKPKTIAVIDGVALGGGLEFALACDYIVVTDSSKVKLGLPEVNLGIIPGWGGTQRLPRRVGLIKAIECIASGKQLSGKQALKLACADAMVPSEFKDESIKTLILNKKLKRRSRKPALIEFMPLFKSMVVRKAKQTIVKKTGGHYPAPLKALSIINSTYAKPLKKGLEIEKKAVIELMESPIPRHLMGLFFSQERIKKSPHTEQKSARIIRHVGIVGAGLMGGGIGWWFLSNQQMVRFKDISWEMVQKGYQAAYKIIKKGISNRKIKPHHGKQMMTNISSSLSYDGFGLMDMVVEAVPETMDLKKRVLKDIESAVHPSTIIATNTSSLDIDALADGFAHPDRFLGVHFFSPVQKMPLVEIIPSKHTSDTIISDVYQMVLKNKKFPVIVKNCPGFLINRVLLPYINEAVHLVIQGFKVDDIDKAAVSFGMPIGPLALADEVGLDIGYKVLKILENGYGNRFKIPEQFDRFVNKDAWLGKKSGIGFYNYSTGTPIVNDRIYKEHSIVMKYRISEQDQSEIIDRLILIMLNEASRCMAEHVVSSPELLDLALIMGTGFPAFRGGLLTYADERGLSDIIHRLNHLSQAVDQRFKPSGFLVTLGKENASFYRNNTHD